MFKKWVRVILSWSAILLLAILLMEARYSWGSYKGKYTISHRLDSQIGIWRVPYQRGSRYTSCYAVEDIEINAYGMRAAAIDSSKKRKIAYFGDSMLEGLQVSQETHFIYQLNRTDSLRDHLNFGMSSTGTAAQWAHFQHFSQAFDFEKVYLFVYLANDLRNNYLPLEKQANGGNRGYLPHFVYQNDRWRLDTNFAPWGARQWLHESHFFRRLQILRIQIRRKAQARHAISALDLGVFQTHYDKAWQQAEAATQHAIQLFADSCRAQDIPFQVVLVPSLAELMPPAERRSYYSAQADSLDWEKPYRRFRRFLAAREIACVDIYAAARREIEEGNWKFPYLSMPCDGHFGERGHGVLFTELKRTLSSK